MKPHAWMLWLVVGLLGTVGALVVSRGWAEKTHDVQEKPGEVEKNFDIDKNDEEPVSPESVETLAGDKIKITTKTFTPPTGWKFKKFTSDSTPTSPYDRRPFNPGEYVDIEIDPQCLPPVVDAPTVQVKGPLPARENPDEIKVVVTELTVPPTAGNFPLKCEGNLIKLSPPLPGGGGGGGGEEKWHWSAKISLVDLDTDTNNNGSIEDSEDDYENYPSGRVVCRNREGDGEGLDDLAEIRLRVDKSPSGSARLEETGATKVVVWDNPDKTGQPISLPKTWPVGEVPSQLWVDGITLGQTTLKLSHEGQFDLVKIFVCDPISWSPRGDTFYAYEPSYPVLGVAGSVAIWERIQSCGWTKQRSYAEDQCTLEKLKEPGNAGLNIGIVALHTFGWHPPTHTDTVEVARGTEAEMNDWMGDEPNMYVAEAALQWHPPPIMFAVKAKAAWFANNWKGTLNANRAIVVMMACNTYPGITGSVGGRSVFGYKDAVLTDWHAPNMNLLFGRLNGSLEDTKWRTTGRAYGALGFQGDFRLYLTPVGEQYPPPDPENPQAFWTTLNPAPNKDWSDNDLHYLTFPRPFVYTVGKEGSGCIVFDTYMKEDGQNPNDAVEVVAGSTVYDNRRWFHNGSGKAFLLSFDFKKETAGICVRAVAEHCLNLDDGERQMSGEREASKVDKDWSF